MNKQEFPKLSHKEFIILQMLTEQTEMYGLEMVETSLGDLKRGTVYVTLQRMGEKGLVESREEHRTNGEIGIARRIYKATGLGQRVLKAQELALKYLNLGWEN